MCQMGRGWGGGGGQRLTNFIFFNQIQENRKNDGDFIQIHNSY
jgi:hypothetical protein